MRVVILTALVTILFGAIALLLGIVSIVIVNLAGHARIDLVHAYRHVAMPVAVAAFALAFVLILRNELREYRAIAHR